MLFPFVIAMLYGAAVYGLTFFAQYRMQAAVDTAVSTALYVDRSENQASNIGTAVSQRANTALAGLVAQLPESLRDNLNTASACGLETIAGGGSASLQSGIPQLSNQPDCAGVEFWHAGGFPPLPAQLDVDARAAF
ncbi:hypothetical protein ACMG4L_13325 [Alcanivorax sp. IL1]|uniref:hypothetical protein n=1 Tax=Alcanivorax sp. IL1 TaxID=3396308 RepID=UPI0039C06996